MSRLRSLVGMGGVLLALGLLSLSQWPASETHLQCAPEQRGVVERHGQRMAVCVGAGPVRAARLPSAAALTLGRKADLNAMQLPDFRVIPGLGEKLASRILERRAALGRFRTWEEVDEVEGMGPGKLRALTTVAEIRE